MKRRKKEGKDRDLLYTSNPRYQQIHDLILSCSPLPPVLTPLILNYCGLVHTAERLPLCIGAGVRRMLYASDDVVVVQMASSRPHHKYIFPVRGYEHSGQIRYELKALRPTAGSEQFASIFQVRLCFTDDVNFVYVLDRICARTGRVLESHEVPDWMFADTPEVMDLDLGQSLLFNRTEEKLCQHIVGPVQDQQWRTMGDGTEVFEMKHLIHAQLRSIHPEGTQASWVWFQNDQMPSPPLVWTLTGAVLGVVEGRHIWFTASDQPCLGLFSFPPELEVKELFFFRASSTLFCRVVSAADAASSASQFYRLQLDSQPSIRLTEADYDRMRQAAAAAQER